MHCIEIKEIADSYKKLKSEIETILSQYICTVDGIKARLKAKGIEGISDELITYALNDLEAIAIQSKDTTTVKRLRYMKRHGIWPFYWYKEDEGSFFVKISYKPHYQSKYSNICSSQIDISSNEIMEESLYHFPYLNDFIKHNIPAFSPLLYVIGDIVISKHYNKDGTKSWEKTVGCVTI